ncbi:hypothetical protein FHR83_007056 [Actinoplanes campanulatus]|uniref:Uncharacterized protein n=1 Tax=Actinoplanes campanulatus TaxID=113559 RepID=A0A7W5ANI6_9ACTN|nr:hypothetical protein [Actinoplanes campanulatus]MBB3099350.1 hypothetical protein [Actinoplanes campanulatus]GGN40355.1 hypothetical protein GCM10010109_69360 [Actinoplanes campanulatus]GID40667.1 hypothetical protein Aca09nite_71730 [Actinoplanes campanulatus]
MTITIHNRDGSLVDIGDTLGILLSSGSEPPTVRITPSFRRPNATGEQRVVIPRTIGAFDSPPDQEPPIDALQRRFNRFYSNRPVAEPAGRHRSADQPGPVARLRALFGGWVSW